MIPPTDDVNKIELKLEPSTLHDATEKKKEEKKTLGLLLLPSETTIAGSISSSS
jgi:hypothetical protein